MQCTNECEFDLVNTSAYSRAMTTGDKIAAAMEAKGFETQKQLQEKSGVSQATISRILKNQVTPELKTLKLFAIAFEMDSAEDLLGDDESFSEPLPLKKKISNEQEMKTVKKEVGAKTENITSNEIAELFFMFNQLNSYKRASILGMAKRLLNAQLLGREDTDVG